MHQTRREAKRFIPRLQCRVAGHDFTEWVEVRTFMIATGVMRAEARECKRRCGLIDSMQARSVPVLD